MDNVNLKYRLFVSDIDGTLIGEDRKISEKNKNMIRLYRQLGGQVTLATGRSYLETKKFIEELGLELPVILCNGAILYDPLQDHLHTVTCLERNKTLNLVSRIEHTLPDVDILIFTPKAIYTKGMNEFTAEGLDEEGFTIVEVNRLVEIPQDYPIIKFVIVKPNVEKTVVPHLQEQPEFDELTVIQSADFYLEVLPLHTSKGKAVVQLADEWNIPLQDVAVIGDHLNDLSMFEVAGLSAAVGNAHPSAKKGADVLMPTNEEHAVAHFLKHYVIPSPSQYKSRTAIR